MPHVQPMCNRSDRDCLFSLVRAFPRKSRVK